jgi:hypothetical protein
MFESLTRQRPSAAKKSFFLWERRPAATFPLKVSMNKTESLPDRRLFDLAYNSVASNPDDINAVRALEFVFAVFSAKLQAWLTARRLDYARTGRDDLADSN